MVCNSKSLALALAAALALSPALNAKTFRWASQGDITSWDVHSHNISLNNGMHSAVYESLTEYNNQTFEVEPLLAVSWEEISPTQVRFNLREGVLFTDGSPFTADDAVFSIERAMAPTSHMAVYTQGIERLEKIDDHTIDVHLSAPNPILLRQFTELRMMSKAWAEKHNSVDPKSLSGSDENFAHRNAMGTGPYMLVSWQPDMQITLQRNPDWWGKMDGNATEVIYQPIASHATRMAALLSGQVDFVLDPTPQDLPRIEKSPNLRVLNGVENRTIFLGMDQHRDALPGSNVKDRNPLKDVKVREALYKAIDSQALTRSTMRGLADPTGAMIAPSVHGWSEELNQRYPYDIKAAREMLTEAGYPDGFSVDFACPNNRYINDEAICQAITAMWARIGVQARLRTLPAATFFPMVSRHEASIYMMGWGVSTFDGLYSLQSLLHTRTSGADGNTNDGRYSNPELDKLIEAIKFENDPARRDQTLAQALQIVKEDFAYLPLHNQLIPWAMKANINAVHRADNRLDLQYVVID